ncbi:MAG TPA: VOC family protein [Nodosilinea sp.]|nr:VOC family protein [Nodosilinea sp.]
MSTSPAPLTAPLIALVPGQLRRIHHLALNVKDMEASRRFYGGLLGLKELTGDEVDDTLKDLVATGKVANFVTPDGLILDLFGAPDLEPPDPDPEKSFTRAYHLAFDIDPGQFDQALAVLEANDISIAHGPVTRPTGRGVYFYDPDGFMVEIRCDPVAP